jgi:hypothetical protein
MAVVINFVTANDIAPSIARCLISEKDGTELEL